MYPKPPFFFISTSVPVAMVFYLCSLLLSTFASATTLSDYPFNFDPDPARYDDEVATLVVSDDAYPPATGAIVGIGSSSMKKWAYRIHSDLEGLTVIPRGFGGSHFTDAIHFAQRLVLDYKPRAVIVYEGDNDTNNGKSPERVRDDLKFFVDYCRTALPNLRVYVLSVKPAPDRADIWLDVIVPANNLMAAYCAETEGVIYIDVGTEMFDGSGKLRADIFQSDQIHLNDAGYDIWAAAIAPVVKAAELAAESEVLCSSCDPLTDGDEIRIDFGNASLATDSPDGEGYDWNNITRFDEGQHLRTLLTIEGKEVPVKVSIVDAFEAVNTSGVTTGALFPSSASEDSFWTGNATDHTSALLNKGVVRFSGLPAGLDYRLSLFPSRNGSDGEMDRLTRYTVDSQTADLDASSNVDTTVVFDGLSPDANGWLDLEVSVSPNGNGRFAYLNALVLEAIGTGWAGFPLVDESYVDTGDWLGWLLVKDAPWLFSFKLSTWIYMPEEGIGNDGSWMFIMRSAT